MSHAFQAEIDHPRRIFGSDATVKYLTFPPRRHSAQATVRGFSRCIHGDQRRVENEPENNVASEAPYSSHVSPVDYCPKDACRRVSTTSSSHSRGGRITKRSWFSVSLRMPLRLRRCGREDKEIPTTVSLASSMGSAEHSSHERTSSNATSISSDPETNNEPEIQLCDNDNDEFDRSINTPDDNDDDSVLLEQHQDTGQSSYPETEHEANLLAAPEDSRHLYVEYYKSMYGDGWTTRDDENGDYWQWSEDKKLWFHKDARTQSVVWFLN